MELLMVCILSSNQTFKTMDTNTNFRISIPKPCHEDWNKFTPDEKGAFCKVCSKSVHDFTKKEPEQIKAILIEEMSAGNKVCGRFNEDQLSPAVEPVPDMNPYSLNFKKVKRFAMALFLVFGGFLFHSTKSTAQKIMGKMVVPQYHEPVRGEIAIAKDPEPVKEPATTKKDTLIAIPKVPKCRMPIKGDVMAEPIEEKYVLGGVKSMPVEEPTVKGNAVIEHPKGQVAIIEEPIIETLGEVMIVPDDEPIKGDTIVTVVEDYPMMGVVLAVPYDVELPVLIDPIPSDSLQNIIDGEFAVEESTYVETPALKGEEEIIIPDEVMDINLPKLKVYPNPTSNGVININYSVKENVPASIIIYDLNGNLVKTLVQSQHLYAADYQSRFDLSDLNDGIYFCELISGNNKTNTRIVISK